MFTDSVRRFLVNYALIVLKQGIFFFSKVIMLKSDNKSMSWVRWSLQLFFLPLMDSFQKVEVGVTFLSLFA